MAEGILKKINLKITKPQLIAIMELCNDVSAMVGGGDDKPDKIWKKDLKLIDRMLKNNGFKRQFD